MRPFIVLVTFIFFLCSCKDIGQGKVQTKEIAKSNLTDHQYLDSARKNDTNSINKTTLTLNTLPNISPGKMTMVSSGQMSPYTTIKIDYCDFELVISGNDTTYLATNDKKFQTPEGYKVGTKLSKLAKDIQAGLTKEPGWGYYYKLPSEWTLGFCEGNSCTDNYPKGNSEVKWIFKRQ